MDMRLRFMTAAAASVFAASLATVSIAAENVAKGTFHGASGHSTKGKVSVVRSGTGYEVRLAKDFSFDGAPDPWIAFGRNGRYSGTNLSVLKSNSGAQTYAVPKSVKIEKFNEIYVWCKRYSVSLGVAKIR